MRRLNPFGSLSGFLLTIILLIGLGVSLWVNRGMAFNPGPVTAITKDGILIQGFKSHADFEKQCVYCHEPLKTDLATKCLDCHVEIIQQLQIGEGVHARIANVKNCAVCHPEHRGRLFNPTEAAYQLFDHSITGFSLGWHQRNYDASPMECIACHQDDDFSIVDNKTCFDCHNAFNVSFGQMHIQDFGADCLGCHDGFDRMRGFNHEQIGYPLEGKHALVKCTDCHTSSDIKNIPTDCKDCHSEPTIHQGLFDSVCNSCHTPHGWSPATLEGANFSHLESAGFSLARHQVDYFNKVITCSTCHPENLLNSNLQFCVDCHSAEDQLFMNEHQQQFGTDCLVCHDGVDRLSNFTHEVFFPLVGRHAEINCVDCHKNNVFRDTPGDCWQCHPEPELHLGLFGIECSNCHTAEAWSPARLEQHSFPLNHGLENLNAQTQCAVCHEANFIDYTCYGCHEHQPDEIRIEHLEEGINEQELPNCIECHPNGLEDEESDN